MDDSTPTDVNYLYAKFGSAPTQSSYNEVYSGPATADPSILISSAAPGNWYFLVYSASARPASDYTIVATGAPVQLSAVSPTYSAGGSKASLTLTGAGFDQATAVSLVYNGTGGPITVDASSVTVDTFNQITATFDTLPTSLEGDTVSIVATQAGEPSATLANAFTITSPGPAHFEAHLILPNIMGRHIASTMYVEYSNTGSEAMPAPLLVLGTATESQGLNIPLDDAQPGASGLGFLDVGRTGGLLDTSSRSWPAARFPGSSSRAKRSRCRSTTPAC